MEKTDWHKKMKEGFCKTSYYCYQWQAGRQVDCFLLLDVIGLTMISGLVIHSSLPPYRMGVENEYVRAICYTNEGQSSAGQSSLCYLFAAAAAAGQLTTLIAGLLDISIVVSTSTHERTNALICGNYRVDRCAQVEEEEEEVYITFSSYPPTQTIAALLPLRLISVVVFLHQR